MEWDESTEEGPRIADYYYRSRFDVQRGRVSTPKKKHCTCGAPCNPDKAMYWCDDCGVWMHEQCLLTDAVKQYAARQGDKLWESGGRQVNGRQSTLKTSKKIPGRPRKPVDDDFIKIYERPFPWPYRIAITEGKKSRLMITRKIPGENAKEEVDWEELLCLTCRRIIS